MDDLYVKPHWWHHIVKKLAEYKVLANIFAIIAHKVDGQVYRMTDGKHTAVNLLTGLPIIQVTTIGAKTGKSRSTPLIGIPDGENFILIASNWGGSRHPGWYYNLLVNPNATVSFKDLKRDYIARETKGAERDSYWQLAVDNYGGYEAYAQRLDDRVIPVIILQPENGEVESLD